MQGMIKIMRRPGCLKSNAHPLSGPSSAFSYAVGIVPYILQLQAEHRGFHLETSVSTLQVSTRDRAFHYEAGHQLPPLRHGPFRQCQQQVRVSQNGAM